MLTHTHTNDEALEIGMLRCVPKVELSVKKLWDGRGVRLTKKSELESWLEFRASAKPKPLTQPGHDMVPQLQGASVDVTPHKPVQPFPSPRRCVSSGSAGHCTCMPWLWCLNWS